MGQLIVAEYQGSGLSTRRATRAHRALGARGWVVALPAMMALASACSGAPVAPRCEGDADCPRGASCRSGSCFFPVGGACQDQDGDGFFDGPGCPTGTPVDCDDQDASINPGADEICGNGVDENCMAGADEGCPCEDVTVGATRDCGMGRCTGIQTCTDRGWSNCTPLIMSVPEVCGPTGGGDGVDDDCDGMVDDGCEECPARPDGTGTERVCPDDGGSVFCSSNGTCL